MDTKEFKQLHYNLYKRFEELLVRMAYYFGSYEKREKLLEYANQRRRGSKNQTIIASLRITNTFSEKLYTETPFIPRPPF